jgi:hypothetical protein
MMDGGAAPGGVCGFGTLHQSLDEIDLVEFDRERRVFEILGRELKRGLGKIDTVIMVDLGAGEGLLHLAGVAANDVDKGEGLMSPVSAAWRRSPVCFEAKELLSTSFW